MSRFLIALAALSALCRPLYAAAAPKTIGFMGVLNDPAGSHLNGDISVSLALYNTDTGGSALWSEVQSVHVTNGLFSTALGKIAPLPTSLDFSQAYFVGITPGSDAEMQPRIPLQGVPYALFAQNVADNSVSYTKLAIDKNSLARVSGGAMASDGTKIGVGTSSPGARLDVKGPLYVDPRNSGGTSSISLAVGDTDTGLNSAGDGQLDVYSNGVNAMSMRGGSVGIGTNTPGLPLDVRSAGFPTAGIQSTSAAGTWLNLTNTTTGGKFWHLISTGSGNGEGAGKLAFASGSVAGVVDAETMVLDNTGKVGIGNSSPQTLLDVSGTVKMTGLQLNSSPGAGKILTSDASGVGSWVTPTANPWLTNGSNLYYNAGSVGLGTDSPINTLDVRGKMSVTGGVIQNVGPAIDTVSDLGLYSTNDGIWMRMVTNNAPIQFFTNYTAGVAPHPDADTTAMTIAANGSVGIGTTGPTAALDVRGDIHLGPAGDVDAAGGVENLRIVRGFLNADGSKLLGNGFTSSYDAASHSYLITFTPAFAEAPSVTATGANVSGEVSMALNILSTNFVHLYAYAGTGLTQAPFAFTAIGPR